jgi:hypothetical protein
MKSAIEAAKTKTKPNKSKDDSFLKTKSSGLDEIHKILKNKKGDTKTDV